MPDAVVDPLILDLLEWLASGERTYVEVIDALAHVLPETSRLGRREGSHVSSRKSISTDARSSGLLSQVLRFFDSEKHPKDLAPPARSDFIR